MAGKQQMEVNWNSLKNTLEVLIWEAGSEQCGIIQKYEVTIWISIDFFILFSYLKQFIIYIKYVGCGKFSQ